MSRDSVVGPSEPLYWEDPSGEEVPDLKQLESSLEEHGEVTRRFDYSGPRDIMKASYQEDAAIRQNKEEFVDILESAGQRGMLDHYRFEEDGYEIGRSEVVGNQKRILEFTEDMDVEIKTQDEIMQRLKGHLSVPE
ncbi:MAG: hypothetical protein SVQ76_00740 [Candidatus Nanohaloarchaea archaeon]|nr:hypothetical protein [Candidatus Nanohaloarchaea archaeon]